MFGADRGGDRVEMPHALDEPGQFVGGDFIGVGIAGLDIGALQLCEMAAGRASIARPRSEEQTSELQSLMRHSYAGLCLEKKNNKQHTLNTQNDNESQQHE